MSNLADLSFDGGSNMGGLLHIQLVSVHEVEQIPYPIQGKIKAPIVLKDGATLRSWYITPQTGQMSNRQARGMEGTHRSKELGFFFPKIKGQNYEQLLMASEDAFVVIFSDLNGSRFLWGNTFFPVYLNFDADSGRVPGDRNGFSCKFFDEAPDNFFEYDPA